jgi:hypothetical protein
MLCPTASNCCAMCWEEGRGTHELRWGKGKIASDTAGSEINVPCQLGKGLAAAGGTQQHKATRHTMCKEHLVVVVCPSGPALTDLTRKCSLLSLPLTTTQGLGPSMVNCVRRANLRGSKSVKSRAPPPLITSRRQTPCTNFQQRIPPGKHTNHRMRSKCLEDRTAPRPTIRADHAHGQDRKSCAAQGGNLVLPSPMPRPTSRWLPKSSPPHQPAGYPEPKTCALAPVVSPRPLALPCRAAGRLY